MLFFTFAVYVELFERVRIFFVVSYTLRCRVRVLNYNLTRSTRYVSIDMLRVNRHAACRIGPTTNYIVK